MKAKSVVSTEFRNILLDGRVVDLGVQAGVIASITPSENRAEHVILPLPVDPHLHLDKTFTASRSVPAKPGLFGAIEAMRADLPNWTETDLRDRMTRALQELYDNGFAAIRSHIDWMLADTPRAWDVLGELAQDWHGRLVIQRASLSPLDVLADPDVGATIAAKVAKTGDVLGCFVYRNDDLEAKLTTVFELAVGHDLWLDFHADEGIAIEADAFDHIVSLTKQYGMSGRVLCGHACSLSTRPADEVARAIEAAAEAGAALTVLPNTNLWLQDSAPGRTPRVRGLAPMQELRAAGVTVLLGADNVADPFYPMGAYDALDVLRTACLAAHLRPSDWLDAITTAPAQALGLRVPEIKPGARADFMLIAGESWEGALRDPCANRQVLRAGELQLNRKDAA